eukprot:scaffold27789_cov140-Isochrysis_galbana.AAC.1
MGRRTRPRSRRAERAGRRRCRCGQGPRCRAAARGSVERRAPQIGPASLGRRRCGRRPRGGRGGSSCGRAPECAQGRCRPPPPSRRRARCTRRSRASRPPAGRCRQTRRRCGPVLAAGGTEPASPRLDRRLPFSRRAARPPTQTSKRQRPPTAARSRAQHWRRSLGGPHSLMMYPRCPIRWARLGPGQLLNPGFDQ